MAGAALHHAVRAEKREFRFRMVEAVDIGPGPHVVAGFASLRCAVGASLGHAIFEFAVVGIRVAGSATAIFEAERHDFVGAACRPHLVTIGARNGGVGSGQYETSVAMLGDGKEGAVKIAHGMAIFAFVGVRSGGELAVMRVLVTIRAKSEFDLVNRIFTGGQMALSALDGNVFAFQRIARCVVLLHFEQGGFPSIQGMAFGALSLFRTSFELAFVGIGLMAIVAVCKWQGPLEIIIDMTVCAINLSVHSQQRIFCLRMIERKCRQ